MPYIPPEVVAKAKEMDLLTYLKNYEPSELVHFGGSTYCTRTHDSLKISNGKWCWFSRGIGGRTALDYLIKVREIPFIEAVEMIVGQAAIQPPAYERTPEKSAPKVLLLPQGCRDATHAVRYLSGRGIDRGIINFCISTGRLYESSGRYHNVVFVGHDRYGKARYATPEMAHEIGVKLAKQLWGEKYQVIVATHLDKSNHLHNHFVVNTVSFLDGIKYHRTGQDYRKMREASDALCREYGLSVIDQPELGRSKQYGEWRAEQENRPTWRGMIRTEIDEAIRQSMTERQFFENLRKRGYEIKVGTDISVRPPGKPRFVRLKRNFGEDYTLENIRRRILAQQRPKRPLPEPERKTYHARLHGDFKSARKITGFRALYFHYCYLLGIFPKNPPKRNKRLHFLLREDLAKMEAISEEVKLLVGNRIDTAEQLSSYKEGLESRIELLTADRKSLYRKQRTVSVKSDEEVLIKVKAQIADISKELALLRREVRLCEDIAIRSGVIREKIKAIREDEQSQGKENKRNEQFRRRSGAGRQA